MSRGRPRDDTRDELRALTERVRELTAELRRRRDPPGPPRPPDPPRDPAASYDALSRKQPHRLGFMAFARGIPGFAAQFTGRVPGEFLERIDGGVRVKCPCGAETDVARFGLAMCDCDRVFAFLDGEVLVAGGVRAADTANVD